MTRPSEYTPDDYDAMFADPERTNGYLAAIERVVGADDVVVEIGTGVGYFAVAACRAGARHVFAIETEASIVLAERLIHENGCAARVTCVRGDANRLTLPERGTVLVSDLRGVLPLRGDGIPTLVNARERLLVPGARMIPVRDTIFAAPCTAPARWAEVELALGDAPRGIARAALARFARSQLHRMRVAPDELCASPERVAEVDYRTITSPDLEAAVTWTVQHAARIEGVALWFDAELADGVGFTTSPLGPKTMYSHAFLPLERPVDAVAGDEAALRLRLHLVDGSYIASWDTTIRRAGTNGPEIQMRQSTLGATLLDPQELARRRSDFIPDPARLRDLRQLLELADGRRNLAQIAATLAGAHSGRFATDAEALRWLTRRYAELYALEEG